MSKSIDDMPVNEAITIYYEKHHAIRTGNIDKLRDIKNQCPDIFNGDKDAQIREMIEDIKTFQNSDRYKEMFRLEVKNKLRLIKNEMQTEKV